MDSGDAVYWIVVLTNAGLLTSMALFAMRNTRPGLLLLSLTLAFHFVYGAVNVELYIEQFSYYFTIREDCLLLAVMYCLLSVVLIMVGYSVPQRPLWWRGSLEASGAHFLVLTVAGSVASALQIYAQGGIASVWARQWEPFQWAGLVSLTANCTLLYPLRVYWNPQEAGAIGIVASLLLTAVYAASALVSGVTGIHVVNAMRFAFIWLSRRKIRFRNVAAVLIGGLLLVNVLRFSRLVGQTSLEGGRWQDAVADYTSGESNLAVARSFPEILVFAEVIALRPDIGLQFGETYLVSPAEIIPGVLWPGKADFIAANRVDSLIPQQVGYSGQLWPMGFYGEGYANFGILGIAASSLLMGWFLRRAELLIRAPGAVFGVPRWCVGCLLIGALVVACRAGFQSVCDLYLLHLPVIVALIWASSTVIPLARAVDAMRPVSQQVRGPLSVQGRRARSWV